MFYFSALAEWIGSYGISKLPMKVCYDHAVHYTRCVWFVSRFYAILLLVLYSFRENHY